MLCSRSAPCCCSCAYSHLNPDLHSSTREKPSQTATTGRSRCGEAAKHERHPAFVTRRVPARRPRVQAGAGQVRPVGRTKIAQHGSAGLWKLNRRTLPNRRSLARPRDHSWHRTGPWPLRHPRAATDRFQVTILGPKPPLSQWSCPTELSSGELSDVGQPRATTQATKMGQSGHKWDTRFQVHGNHNKK